MSDKNRKLGIVVGTPDLAPLYLAESLVDSGVKELSSLSINNLSSDTKSFNIFSKKIIVPFTDINRAPYLNGSNYNTYISMGPSGQIGPGVRWVGSGPSLPSGGLNNPVIQNAYWEGYIVSSGSFVWLGPQSGYELISGNIIGPKLTRQFEEWNNSINFYQINPSGANIVEVSNQPIIVTASGNWGGFTIEWQSSPDKINWSNFNLSQIPRNADAFPSIGGYFYSDERSIPDIYNVVSGGNVLLNKEYLNIGIWSGFSGMFCPTIGGYNVRTLYSGLNNGSWDRLSFLRLESNCNSLNNFGTQSGTWVLSLANQVSGFTLPFRPPETPVFIPYPTIRWKGDLDNYYYISNSSSISEIDLASANWQAASPGTTVQLPIPKFIPLYRRSRDSGGNIYVYSGQLPSGHKYLRLRDSAGSLGGGNLKASLTYYTPSTSGLENEWPKPCEYFSPTILASEFPNQVRITPEGTLIPSPTMVSSSVSLIYNSLRNLNNTGVLAPINLFGEEYFARFRGIDIEPDFYSGNFGQLYSANNFSLSETFSTINPSVSVIGNVSGRFQYTVAKEGFIYQVQFTRNLNSGWLNTGILSQASPNQNGIASGFTRMEYFLPLTELAGGNLFFRVRVQAIDYLEVGGYVFYESPNSDPLLYFDPLLFIFDDRRDKTFILNPILNEITELPKSSFGIGLERFNHAK